MPRDHLKRYEVVLETKELISGRWHEPGDTVNVYGDTADRLEAQRRAHAKRKRKSEAKSEAKAKAKSEATSDEE
jgi:hypothetical protein